MGLVVLTNESLDEMESWLVEIVSEIENRNLNDTEINQPLFKSGTLPATLRPTPITSRTSGGFLTGSPPSAREHYATKPLAYISNLIVMQAGSLHEVWSKRLDRGPFRGFYGLR